jgi:hypothetical protein
LSANTPLDAEHSELLKSAKSLIGYLDDLGGRLNPGRVSHQQHYDYSDRAQSLALYLSGAVDLLTGALYGPAFAVLRAALEHHVLDLLIFLARRYVQVIEGVNEETWSKWTKARTPGAAEFSDVISWHRSSRGRVELIKSGIHVSGGNRGPTAAALSIYYFLMKEYDPFRGKPGQQSQLTSDFVESRAQKAWARESQRLYGELLRWESLRKNLYANRLFSRRDLTRLDVHYSFLSAFIHPTSAGHHLIYGQSSPVIAPQYDHYCSELGLLYVNIFALRELEAFGRMSRRTPRVRLDAWDEVMRGVGVATALTKHLWFPPGGTPHIFDRVETANHRGVRGRKLVDPSKRIPPAAIPPSGVRYYRNPLLRLIRMHASFTELTGFSYKSPWERVDAVHRH